MMLSQASGKVGYVLYKNNKGERKEEMFTGESHHGCPDELVHDVVVPELRKKLISGRISFFALCRSDKFGEDYWEPPFELHIVGAEKQSYEAVLPKNRCLIVYTLAKNFIWSPDAATKEDKEFFKEHAQKWLDKK